MENPSCVLTSAESIWTKAGEAAHIKMAWIIGVWKRMVTRSISISETVTNASIGSYWPHLHFLSLNILECLSTNLVVLLAHLALLSNIRGHCHYRCPKIMNTNDFFSIMFWCTCRGASMILQSYCTWLYAVVFVALLFYVEVRHRDTKDGLDMASSMVASNKLLKIFFVGNEDTRKLAFVPFDRIKEIKTQYLKNMLFHLKK